MGTDTVLTALAFKTCMEIDWDKMATKHGFVRYDFTNGKVLGLEKVSAQVEKRACGSGGSFTTLKLAAVSVYI